MKPARKPSERNAKKKAANVAMTHINPNYTFGDAMLSTNELNHPDTAPSVTNLHNFYMGCCKDNDESLIQGIIWPKHGWWPVREDEKYELLFVIISDLYDLFNLDALDMGLLHCFIL